MLKIITILLMMGVGSIIFHTFIAESPNYIETAQMMYWFLTITIVYWISGLLNTGDKQ